MKLLGLYLILCLCFSKIVLAIDESNEAIEDLADLLEENRTKMAMEKPKRESHYYLASLWFVFLIFAVFFIWKLFRLLTRTHLTVSHIRQRITAIYQNNACRIVDEHELLVPNEVAV